MTWLIIVIVVLLLAGIAYFGSTAVSKHKPRAELIADFATLVEGKLTEADEFENSHYIRFDFEKHDFLYEDVEMQGFKDKVHKSYLKTDIGFDFTLTFGEKRSQKLIGSSNSTNQGVVRLPKALSEFGAYSNKPRLAAEVLEDPKVVKIFRSYKNVDPRGKAFISMNIASGTIVLEFDSTGSYVPKPLHYLTEASSVEAFLDQMIYIKKVINDLNSRAS